jgi:hypothetical protein
MMMFKGVAVSILLPVWALAMMLVIAATSAAIESEVTPIDTQLEPFGLGSLTDQMFETTMVAVLVGVLLIQALAAVVTSRAVAAMAGAVGGLTGAVIAGLVALAAAAAPSGIRVEALSGLTHPGVIAALAGLSAVLGFRAYLAHVGRWKYAKQSPYDSWDDGGFD